MTNNVPPNPPPGSGPNPSSASGPASSQGPSPAPSGAPQAPSGQGQGKSLQWLGMTFDPEQTKQLNNIMIQNIGQEIQKYNDKGIKAIKNYQKVSEGQDPDE